MSFFKDKVLMITGGTGSFGSTVLHRFLTTDIKEIRVFSRDEKKQDDLRHELQVTYPTESEKVKFYKVGDSFLINVPERSEIDQSVDIGEMFEQ